MEDAAQQFGDQAILANMIRAKAAAQPDLDVLTFVDIAPDGSFKDETRTYRQLWERGCKLAHALEERGVKPGDHFALLMQNHPEFVEAMVAASIIGAVFVPIDPRTRGEKLAYMLNFAECTGAIVADYAWANLREVKAHLDWIAVFGPKTAEALSDPRAFALTPVFDAPLTEMTVRTSDASAPMQMLYTSGTTGDPKAIIANHRRFTDSGLLGHALGMGADDRPYTGLSLTHANAQLVTLGMILRLGLRGVISRRFTKARLWDIARAYGCTMFNLLGGMTVELYSQPEQPNDADNPVRMVLSAGMPADLWEKFSKRFGVGIFEFYGAAEGGLTLNPPGVGPVGSVGKPPPGLELAILDEDGAPLAAGEAGEICFRPLKSSASVQYFKNQKASSEKAAGGWLHTGDIGHVDKDGWLFFHHRKGNDIRRNGEFINPGFVEKSIAECAQVADVFVYGTPSQSGAPGEKDVVAAIVPADARAFDADALFVHCRRVLEANSVPSYLQIVSEIPKTASEKPIERLLAEAFHNDTSNIVSDPARAKRQAANR